MAKLFGNFDRVIGYKPDDIDIEFYETHKEILSQKRGGGYWLWKPYFVYKTLKNMNNGDYLFYCDSASFMHTKIDLLIKELNENKQDIMGFELPLVESQWTKKELMIAMECNQEKYTNSNQIMASFYLIKKSDFSVTFYKELLDYSCNKSNITDQFDKNIIQNIDFIDHRHDQSIFSLLYKKHNLKPFKDPSQFGKHPYDYSGVDKRTMKVDLVAGKLYFLENGRKFRYFDYAEKYSPLLFHYRRSNPLILYVKYRIKEALHSLGLHQNDAI
jgi:hypothetical protein